ncbi:MAG: ATP synthase F1 subunit delta [Candidatus Obscuribacterales bacterium]|nr:ATP synthase F1 subunit delta [Candidatus Obscuribacterales bacterium]
MKAEDRGSAVQYANALLQLTDATGDAESVFTNLEIVNKVFEANPEFAVLFRHPSISAPQKKLFLQESTVGLDQLSSTLLQVLCERRKLNLLPLIIEEFRDLLREKHNIVTGTLTSAEAMDEEAVSSIKQKLVKQLRKHVELTVKVDKSLIGGYVLRIGDQVLDGSLKGRLQSIEKALLSV